MNLKLSTDRDRVSMAFKVYRVKVKKFNIYGGWLNGNVKAFSTIGVYTFYSIIGLFEFLIGSTCLYNYKILWLLEVFYFQFNGMYGHVSPCGNVSFLTFQWSGVLLG